MAVSSFRIKLDVHSAVVAQSVARRTSVLGLVAYDRETLERLRGEGQKLDIRVVGAVVLADDVPPKLASDVIDSLKVYGVLRSSQAVKDALADRMA